MNKKISCIYKIKSIIDGKFYIGQTVNFYKRKSTHFDKLKSNKHYNCYLQNAFNKYGKDNFIFEVIIYCEPEELTYYEQKLVDFLEPEYNIRRECVDSPKGMEKSEEHRKRLSEANKGKHPSEETLKKKSMSMMGKIHTEESKQKMSDACKGRVFSEEHKKNLSEAHKGKPAFNKGIPFSEESKNKMSESAKKRWSNKNSDGIK